MVSNLMQRLITEQHEIFHVQRLFKSSDYTKYQKLIMYVNRIDNIKYLCKHKTL